MNTGLFCVLAGFLLPVALVLRLAWLIASELWRGWSHPLILTLASWAVIAAVPAVALGPTVWSIVTGRSIEAGAMLLDFNATRWGLAKVAVSTLGVLLADLALPRVYDQLTRPPFSETMPTRQYILRDLGVLATCLLLACVAAYDR